MVRFFNFLFNFLFNTFYYLVGGSKIIYQFKFGSSGPKNIFEEKRMKYQSNQNKNFTFFNWFKGFFISRKKTI